MSHFAVLVIGEDPEKQLEKFDENLELDRYVEYTKQELIDKEKKSIEDYRTTTYAQYLKDPIKYSEECTNENHLNYLRNDFPKKLEMSDDDIYKDSIKWYDPEDIGPEGEVYSVRNNQSKWDWYQIGGRYAGQIMVKPGVEIEDPNFSWGWEEEDRKEITDKGFATDQAYVKDIDFPKMHRTEESYNESLRYWELIVEEQKPKNSKEKDAVKFSFYKPSYYIERYKDKENFAKCRSSFSMWAVVKDGVWYEKGEMGWFAMSDETHDEAVDWEMNFFDRFIKDLPEDTLLTVIDCHI